MSPPGGDIDTIPPEVLETYPNDGTIFFSDDYIEFTFSEYVNKRTVQEALFISPFLEGSSEFSWTNKTVKISFSEPFKENTTYSIILGTDITDVNNNNRMNKPFNLIFSTGAEIDSGKITGKIFGNRLEGTLIFAYKVDTTKIDITKKKPDYVSQINKNGEYILSSLSYGNYLVFAVKDEFRDLLYNIGDDRIGIPSTIVKINQEKKNFEGLNFFLSRQDTTPPSLQNVTMVNKNNIVIEFSEPIDSSKISTTNFAIYDSTLSSYYDVTYIFQSNNKKFEYILSIKDSLNFNNNNYLKLFNIFDKNGNLNKYQIMDFTVNAKKDTSSIKISKISTIYDNNKIDYLNPYIDIFFNEAFDIDKAKYGFKLQGLDSIFIPIKTNFFDDASVRIEALQNLKPNTVYNLFIDLNYFTNIYGKRIDTLISKRIYTINELDFSGASGKVQHNSTSKIIVVLQDAKKPNRKQENELNNEGTFDFSRILPGEYLIWAYIDRDSSNSYTFGNISPFIEAEYFKFYPDTLNLKPRWPIGDIEITLIN